MFITKYCITKHKIISGFYRTYLELDLTNYCISYFWNVCTKVSVEELGFGKDFF